MLLVKVKCNHVADVLLGLLVFQQTVEDAPERCTTKEQKWHQPSRKAKMTKPLKIGKQYLTQAPRL